MSRSPVTTVAAILVGGKGTRLRTLVSDVPKPLAQIGQEPFLFLILKQLASIGIKKVILLTGYLHEKIFERCGNGALFGLEILYSREVEPLGTGGALANARPHLEKNADFLLLNGDTHLTCSLAGFVNKSLENDVLGAICIVKPEDSERYGSVELNRDGTIKAFREKDQQGTGLISAGVYKFSSRIFDFLTYDQPSSLETDILPSLIERGEKIQSFYLEAELSDIGLPESYMHFNIDYLLNSIDLSPLIKECFANQLASVIKDFEHES